uniref:G-protein coupled receptors family 3 profile domain-containing protein n=1 Tax=Vombatus ursinus TaxID=29139 RepID=A0A4X2JPM0_VOMUR
YYIAQYLAHSRHFSKCGFIDSLFALFFIFFSHFSTLRKYYQHILTFQFAVDEINKNPNLLPNITLGYQLLNNFHLNSLAVESSLIWLSRMGPTVPNYSCGRQPNSVAIIGGMSSTLSMAMATILKLYKVPQITYGLFGVLPTDKIQYLYVYQMGIRESTWVGVVLSDNERGENFFSDLKEEMVRNGLCVAFKERVSPNVAFDEHYNLTSRIIASSNVIFIYGDTDSLQQLVFAFVNYVLYGKMLVATTSWDFSFDSSFKYLAHFHGIILFSHSQMEILGFTDFVRNQNSGVNPGDIFLKAFLESAFKCRISDKSHIKILHFICSESVSFTNLHNMKFDTIIMELSSNVYNAVYLLAHALHQMLQSEAKDTSEFGSNPELSWKVTFLFHSWALAQGTHNIHLLVVCSIDDPLRHNDILNFKYFPGQIETLVKVGETSEVIIFSLDLSFISHSYSDIFSLFMVETHTLTSTCSLSCGPGFKKTVGEGQPICCFDCTPCPERQISNQTDAEECLQCPEDEYPSWERDQCLPKTVTFLAYEEPLGMSLACAALYFSLLTALVLAVFVKHRDTPIVKANNRTLSYILLVFLSLCFLCSLLFIGHPNTATCLLRQTTFAVVFTVTIASILAKTITAVLAFKATKPRSKLRRGLGSTTSYSLILICTLIQMCLCGIWLGTYLPLLETDIHSEPVFIVIQCNEGSILTFYCVLGYMAFLALGSFTVAFLAKNLPDTFNEAKFLTFSMLVFCSVFISFLPTYQGTKGKPLVAVELFSILTSSAGILTCIFAPKCYVTLLRSERNTLKIIKNKANL